MDDTVRVLDEVAIQIDELDAGRFGRLDLELVEADQVAGTFFSRLLHRPSARARSATARPPQGPGDSLRCQLPQSAPGASANPTQPPLAGRAMPRIEAGLRNAGGPADPIMDNSTAVNWVCREGCGCLLRKVPGCCDTVQPDDHDFAADNSELNPVILQPS